MYRSASAAEEEAAAAAAARSSLDADPNQEVKVWSLLLHLTTWGQTSWGSGQNGFFSRSMKTRGLKKVGGGGSTPDKLLALLPPLLLSLEPAAELSLVIVVAGGSAFFSSTDLTPPELLDSLDFPGSPGSGSAGSPFFSILQQ